MRDINKPKKMHNPIRSMLCVGMAMLLIAVTFAPMRAFASSPEEFQFEVRVGDTAFGDGNLSFAIPLSGNLNMTYNAYNWNIDWGDTSTQTSSGTGAATSAGISHTYNDAGIYTITITPAGSSDKWLAAFGFTTAGGASAATNKAKVVSIISAFTPLMTRTQSQLDTNAAPTMEWAYTFYGCTNLGKAGAFTNGSGTGAGFIPEWDGITTVGNYFCWNMFYGCTSLTSIADSFSLPPNITTVGVDFCKTMFRGCTSLAEMGNSFNLPQGITTVGSAFCYEMFRGCTSLLSMSENFNLPQGITVVSGDFAYAMFYGCSSLAAMSDVFNLPQGITIVGTNFCGGMFQGCSSLLVNDIFTFPHLSQSELNKANVFVSTLKLGFTGTFVPQTRTAASIINGNASPFDEYYPGGTPSNVGVSPYSRETFGYLTGIGAWKDIHGINANWGGQKANLAFDKNSPDATNGSVTSIPVVYNRSLNSLSAYLSPSVLPETTPQRSALLLPVGGTTPTRDGYIFKGWNTTKAGAEAGVVNFDIDNDTVWSSAWPYTQTTAPLTTTVYAVWEDESVQVTFDPQNGSQTTTIEATNGEVITPPVSPVKIGHTFIGWYTEPVGGMIWDFSTPVTEDMTLWAQWDVLQFTVTFDHNFDSVVDTVGVEYGERVDEPDNPLRNGYQFIGWYTAPTFGELFDFDTVITSNTVVYAHWQVIEKTVTFDPQNGSSSFTTTVAINEPVNTPSDPTHGEDRFTGWYTHPNGGTKWDFDTPVTENMTLYAQYESVVIPVPEQEALQVVARDTLFLLKGTHPSVSSYHQMIGSKVIHKEDGSVFATSGISNDSFQSIDFEAVNFPDGRSNTVTLRYTSDTGIVADPAINHVYIVADDGEWEKLPEEDVKERELPNLPDGYDYYHDPSGKVLPPEIVVVASSEHEKDSAARVDTVSQDTTSSVDTTDTVSKGNIPKTGDSADVVLWVVALLSASALLALCIPQRKDGDAK